MTVEAFILNFNEDLLHLTIKHYQQYCDKITILDNYSTDGSDLVAESLGCHVQKFGIKGELNDAKYIRVKDHCWKTSTCDFVIICDADEILWHPRLTSVLEEAMANRYTIFKTAGFNVYSHHLPKQDYFEVQTGVWDTNYDKNAIFSPKYIKDIRYAYGAHTCKPEGIVNFSPDTLILFHYRNIGGPDRLVQRHTIYRKRMGELNNKFGLGCHYNYDDERRVKEWNEYHERSSEFSQVGFYI